MEHIINWTTNSCMPYPKF